MCVQMRVKAKVKPWVPFLGNCPSCAMRPGLPETAHWSCEAGWPASSPVRSLLDSSLVLGMTMHLSMPGFLVCVFWVILYPFLLWPRQLLVFFKWICLLWMPLINGFIYLLVFDVFKVPSHCNINQYFISSHGWITCHFMGVPDLLTRLTVDEHLSCFCFWTIMNDDTWTFVCKLLETSFHFLWSGTPLTVRGIVKHFPIKLYHFTSHQQQRVWQFHHISLNLYQCLLYYRYSNWCGVIHIYHAKNLLIQYFTVMKTSLYSLGQVVLQIEMHKTHEIIWHDVTQL